MMTGLVMFGNPDDSAMLTGPPPLMSKSMVLVCPVAALLCWMAQRSEPALVSSLVLTTVNVLGSTRSSNVSKLNKLRLEAQRLGVRLGRQRKRCCNGLRRWANRLALLGRVME